MPANTGVIHVCPHSWILFLILPEKSVFANVRTHARMRAGIGRQIPQRQLFPHPKSGRRIVPTTSPVRNRV